MLCVTLFVLANLPSSTFVPGRGFTLAQAQATSAQVTAAMESAERLLNAGRKQAAYDLLLKTKAKTTPLAEPRLWLNLAELATATDRKPAAIGFAESALEGFRKKRDALGETKTLVLLMEAEGSLRREREALEAAKRGGTELELELLVELARLTSEDPTQGPKHATEAENKAQGMKKTTEVAAAKINRAVAAAKIYRAEALSWGGKYDEARVDFTAGIEQLRPFARNRRDQRLLAEALGALGIVCHYMGGLEEAEAAYRESYEIFSSLLSTDTAAGVVESLSLVYVNQRKYKKADELLVDIRKKALLVNDKSGAAFCDVALGYSLFTQGRFRESLDRFRDAMEAGDAIDIDYPRYCGAGGMAMNLAVLGEGEKAVPLAIKAEELVDKIGTTREKCIVQGVLGVSYHAAKLFDKSDRAYQKCSAQFEALSDQLSDPGRVGQYQETLPHLYGHYADMLIDAGRPMDALGVLEGSRARGLARQLAFNGGGDWTTKLPTELRDEYNSIMKEIHLANASLLEAERAQARVPGGDGNSVQLENARLRVRAVEARYARFRDAIYVQVPDIRDRIKRTQAPPTIADLEALARRNPDTVYVEWGVVDERYTLLFVHSARHGLCTFRLPWGENRLIDEVRAWHSALARGGSRRRAESATDAPATPASGDEKALARRTFEGLLGPAEAAGLLSGEGIERLVVVPDGVIGEVPIAALIDPRGRRLADRLTVSSAVSLGSLLWPQSPFDPTTELLCVADPSGSAPPAQTDLFASVRAGFSPLKFAAEEGRAVSSLFPGSSPMIGEAAREAAVKEGMRTPRILHFACHGIVDSANPLRNGLVLAPELGGSGEDGVLQGREIITMTLPARLAVLSACDTGQGAVSGGDGIQSLAWAFRAAGCENVLASHWQVDDRATSLLMSAFYRHAKAGERLDTALGKAVAEVRRAPGLDDPYYWAAFELFGKGSPMF